MTPAQKGARTRAQNRVRTLGAQRAEAQKRCTETGRAYAKALRAACRRPDRPLDDRDRALELAFRQAFGADLALARVERELREASRS